MFEILIKCKLDKILIEKKKIKLYIYAHEF